MHLRKILPVLALAAFSQRAAAQSAVSFTIDGHGPTISAPDAFTGTAITEGDVLTPATGTGVPFTPSMATLAAPGPPGILISGGIVPPLPPPPGLGLFGHAACVGHPPGVPCPIEVDALSYGTDLVITQAPTPPGTYWFSVDEYARGAPPIAPGPNVTTEGFLGPEFEASGDAFIDLGAPGIFPGGPPTYAPFIFPFPGNVGAIDGDGLPNTSGVTYPGIGIVEPDIPSFIFPSTPPDTGDNQDGMDVDDVAAQYPVYFSLDAAYVDPISGHPLSATAVAHGFFPSDVLVTTSPFVGPVVYAPAAMLGMDFPAADDLDALILAENGVPGYQPSVTPFDWVFGGTDMLLFSVRRGSALVGLPDSIYGLAISEGDILTTPLPTALGGVSPFAGIFIAAENLGLRTTRSGPFLTPNDDLDALDAIAGPLFDCNFNGTEDAIDINSGSSTDVNTNGIPDECELISSAYCFCPSSVAICNNPDPAAGCANSTGVGSIISASGTSSITNDDMILSATAPTNVFGVFFMGPIQLNLPFGDGRRCLGAMPPPNPVSTQRYYPPINSGPTGVFSLGPVVGFSLANFPVGTQITALSTWNFQCWYRDSTGPCNFDFNLSNGLSVTFTP